MKPLTKKDFRPAKELTPSYFRATSAPLSRADFDAKWKLALKSSPFRFLRAFPHAWHLDLADVRSKKIPGGEAFCLGDPHPGNFGFVTFESGPAFVYDDLDDAGPGRAAIDAARYFASLRFLNLSDDTVDRLASLYVAITRDRDYPRPFPLHLRPDVDLASREELLRWTDGSQLRTDGIDLQPVPDWRADAIFEALAREESAAGFSVIAVARRLRKRGGSGGLARYLISGRNPDGRVDLLELKEMPPAATSWARRLREPDDRLERAVATLWKGKRPRHHRSVRVGNVEFLLRSRLGRADVDVEALSDADRDRVLEAQVSILASAHRGAYGPREAEGLADWVKGSAKVIHRRYAAVHSKLRS